MKIKSYILIGATILFQVRCDMKDDEWPLPMFEVVPNVNEVDFSTNRNIILDATFSEDYRDNGILQYRWDFNNDGFWDTPFLTDSFAKTAYAERGYYVIKLQVKNESDKVAEATGLIDVWDEATENNLCNLYFFYFDSTYLLSRVYNTDSTYRWTSFDISVSHGNYSAICSEDPSGFLYDWNTTLAFNTISFQMPSRADWEKLFEAFGGKEIAGLVFEPPSQSFIEISYTGKMNRNEICEDLHEKAYYWTSDIEGDSAWAVVFEKGRLDAGFEKVHIEEKLLVKLLYSY